MNPADPGASFELAKGVLHVYGEIDFGEEKPFEKAVERLLAESAPELVIDLTAVGYMNSSCVRYVASAMMKAKDGGLTITIRAKRRVLRLFEMAGIDKIGVLVLVEDK